MDRRTFLTGLAAVSLVGCNAHKNQIAVGTKNFTEQLILGEILAQSIEQLSHTPVERRFYLAGTYICQQAILAGRIDTYVEYTGTALGAILKQHPSADHAQVLQRVTEEYRRRFDLQVLPPLGFNNSFAIIMRDNDARRLQIQTLSQLAPHAPQLRLGVGYEFLERQDGFTGLARTYGLNFQEAPRVMDLGLLYRAIQSNWVDVIAGANTDALISALDLIVLADDRSYFPPYDAVPIVRRAALNTHPEIGVALNRLGGRISVEQMRQMNYAADVQKQDVSAISKKFLAQQTSPG
jgi:osmoprotectant transport system substrate-binding protein